MSNPINLLRQYAQNTGAFRVSNQGASNLAQACVSVAELFAAADGVIAIHGPQFHGPADPKAQQKAMDRLKVALERMTDSDE